MTADEIKKVVTMQAFSGFEYVTTEFSPYHSSLRFDVIGIRRFDRTSRICEVKSCRADFLSDKKWRDYLPYATHFYFAAPAGAIHIDELPPEVGLMEIVTCQNGHMTFEYIRKCRKLPPISDENYIKIIEGAYVRLKWEMEEIKKGAHYE